MKKSITICLLMISMVFVNSGFAEDLSIRNSHDLPSYDKKVYWDSGNKRSMDFVAADHNTFEATVTQIEHERTHDGDNFIVILEFDIGLDGTTSYIIECDPALATHIFWSMSSLTQTDLWIIANATTGSQGSEVAVYNENANFAVTPLVSIYEAGEIAGGYIWDKGVSGKSKNIGGGDSHEGERVSAPGMVIGVSVLSAGANNEVTLKLGYYTSTDGIPD